MAAAGGLMLFGCGVGMFHRHHACAGWLAVGICIMMESGGVIWDFFGWAVPLLFWYWCKWLVLFFDVG